ncbi:hypothetical protein O181_029683 [Austropuccinia psidii MF-1]|uniref:Uncharacterized protein n=1 Tax=Austropuccinia psidii MF-1 TaxID=1389203 RepID=A0A9Q3H2Z0_9BASI|nr:hypothetical protein [Austropuccinia psidii MF-1]
MSSKLTELPDSSPSLPPPSIVCGSGILSWLASPWKRDVARWTNVGGSIPVCGRTIYSSSAVPISRINTEVVVKRISRIANSPADLYAEGTYCPKISSTPRNFQLILGTISTSLPPASPSSSHTRPAINPAARPSPIQMSRASPIVTSQQLQPEASSGRRKEDHSPLPFPAAQVFQKSYCWPIQVTREDPNTDSENQDSAARLF